MSAIARTVVRGAWPSSRRVTAPSSKRSPSSARAPRDRSSRPWRASRSTSSAPPASGRRRPGRCRGRHPPRAPPDRQRDRRRPALARSPRAPAPRDGPAPMAAGAAPDAVARQVPRCGPGADPRSARRSPPPADAAATARRNIAAAHLERALAERAPGDDRGRLPGRAATGRSSTRRPPTRASAARAPGRGARPRQPARCPTRPGRTERRSTSTSRGCSALLSRSWPPRADPRVRPAIEAAAPTQPITIHLRHEERARRVAA